MTNYVLLELGQPLHAFDLNKLNGDIEVRFARAGESLKLLNEQVVDLQDDMLVIADGKGPVALAGVMGGADSAVGDATTDIFLESAFFAPSVIVGKSRLLGFSSDSSYRFERGVDFAGYASSTGSRHAIDPRYLRRTGRCSHGSAGRVACASAGETAYLARASRAGRGTESR